MFKRPIAKGLAGLLPAILTVAVLVVCFNFLNNHIGKTVNILCESTIVALGGEEWAIEKCASLEDTIGFAPGAGVTEVVKTDKGEVPVVRFRLYALTGLIMAVILIYLVGLALSSFAGRLIWPYVERSFLRLPVVRAIYPHAKQLTGFLFAERSIKYRGVVALEYPRKGVYQIALVTNVGLKSVCEKTGKKMLMVFVPTSPTPVTGYTAVVAEEDVINLNMPIDQAFRLIVSGGVIIPENQTPENITISDLLPKKRVAELEDDVDKETEKE